LIVAAPPAETASAVDESELKNLRARLAEAEETLHAIRRGDVDAVVIEGPNGPQVYTLENADRPYRLLVERMQEGALTLSPDGAVLYANQALAQMLCLPADKIVGQRFHRFVANGDQSELARLLANTSRGELELRAADGKNIPVFISTTDLPDETQRVICAIVTDLTLPKLRTIELTDANTKLTAALAERERAETLLRQAQKMEAVGQLTAGIAHDFNNLLTVVAGNLEMIEERVDDPRLKTQVATVQRAIHRGMRLTDQLLAFSHQRTLHPRPVSVENLLRETEPLLRRAVGDEINIALVLGERIGHSKIDPTELQASMLNLAINAKDAMPAGGTLTITATEVEAKDIPIDGAEVPLAGRYAAIVVSDTGHGMSSETRERAFDPFFTTKEVGKGTGLGLSQVYGFIRQSGGYVTIDSEIGAGTCIRLFLPAIDALAEGEAPRPTRPLARAPGPRTVLVVEDDEDVRPFMIETLQDLGYAAIAAENGPAALRLLDRGTAVDVVFSDVRMPDGMSGFELVEEVRRRLPSVAIVLTSGMASVYEAEEETNRDWPLLRKPFRRDDVLKAIEEALALRRATAYER
jgi:PAS domain S-box-containing protein